MEVEKTSLLYAKKVEVERSAVAERPQLPPKMEEKDCLVTLTAVGMLTRGDYICYEALKEITRELPISQAKLISMKVQSGFTL